MQEAEYNCIVSSVENGSLAETYSPSSLILYIDVSSFLFRFQNEIIIVIHFPLNTIQGLLITTYYILL